MTARRPLSQPLGGTSPDLSEDEDGQHGGRRSDVAAEERQQQQQRRSNPSVHYDAPDDFENLGEVAAVSPVQRPDENGLCRVESLDQVRARERELRLRRSQQRGSAETGGGRGVSSVQGGAAGNNEGHVEEEGGGGGGNGNGDEVGGDWSGSIKVSRLATEFYTVSYLVFFSIMGTLARLGLVALTTYPGAPVTFPSLWPNFAGSLVMGFLAEDRKLFRDEWGTPGYGVAVQQAKTGNNNNSNSSSSSSNNSNNNNNNTTNNRTPPNEASAAVVAAASEPPTLPPVVDLAAAKRAHSAVKKTIPLYIGLATGFCGSFTSFSALMRDVFLALSNDLPAPGMATPIIIPPRNGGYSFLALVAVALVTISSSLAGLFAGAHLAVALEPAVPSLPFRAMRRYADRLGALLGWGCWLGAVLLSALPPDRGRADNNNNNGLQEQERWRGAATFALVFAPLGTLVRFYTSLRLNVRVASFPLGTFVVNVAGVAVLGVMWDLAHIPVGGGGGTLACQLLQGVEDGFCGCLTTVSTWVAELSSLRARHAYFYGAVSVLLSLSLLVVVMGSVKWGRGFDNPRCYH